MSAQHPGASPYPSRCSARAALIVTQSNIARISASPVMCPTCRPMCATSSMSWLPRGYHGSITQSWPQATLTPAEQLLDPRHASALGVTVVPALERDVDERVRDRRHRRLVHERDELGDVIVVHGVHRGEVRADDAALQAVADRLAGQDLDVARERVVGLVTVHVHQETAVGGDATETLDGGRPVRHRPLEVRNATDDVDAEVERRREPRLADRGAQEA